MNAEPRYCVHCAIAQSKGVFLTIGSPFRLPQGDPKFSQTNMCNEAMAHRKRVVYNFK